MAASPLTKGARIRMFIVSLPMICMAGAVVYRFQDLQVKEVRGRKMAEIYAAEHQGEFLTQSRRGSIKDRNGELLAVSVEHYLVAVDPSSLDESQLSEASRLLGEVLRMDRREVAERLAAEDNRYVVLKRQLSDDEAAAVSALAKKLKINPMNMMIAIGNPQKKLTFR